MQHHLGGAPAGPCVEEVALVPLEIFTECVHFPRDAAFTPAVERWRSGDGTADWFRAIIATDSELLRRWLRGTDLRELAQAEVEDRPSQGPLRRGTSAERLLDLTDYFSGKSQLGSWMYSGVVRVADYLRTAEGEAVPDELWFGVDYLRLGVSNRAATFLADRVRVPRVAAMRMAEAIEWDKDDVEASTLNLVLPLGYEDLLAIVRDRHLAEESWHIIRGHG